METSAASGTSEMTDASAAYALGHSPAERDRLRRQPDELRDDSEVLLDRVGIAEGSSAIDLGCGPQGILDLLADRVGPAGRVTGVDFHPASVAGRNLPARPFAPHSNSSGRPAAKHALPGPGERNRR